MVMIAIDLESSVPLEEQLWVAIRGAIARGAVQGGDSLPSVRQLSADLGVHFNTVARAYRRLQEEGLVVVRRGRGAVVKLAPETRSAVLDAKARACVDGKMSEAITEARLAGMSLAETKRRMLESLRQWEARVV